MEPKRPSVPRDIRLLLSIVLISISSLWVLARIRFPERVQTPNPVVPVLAQLTPRSAFEDIAASVAQAEARVRPLLIPLDVEQSRATAGPVVRVANTAALRFRNDLAVTLIPKSTSVSTMHAADADVDMEVTRDRASQLAIVRVQQEDIPALTLWSPARLAYPRFLLATDVAPDGISLRPVFVGALYAMTTAVWSGAIWVLPDATDIKTGSFVFSSDGSLVGLAIEHEGRRAIVPGERLIAAAARLAQDGARRPGRLGVQLQPLTADIAAAIGSRGGTVVAWVDPRGPAAGQLSVADIIERVDDRALITADQWQARVASLVEGESIMLTVRRSNQIRTVQLTAVGPEARRARPLGLTARTIPRMGAEIVRVAPDSAAFRAGLLSGDIITAIGRVETPTAGQLSREFVAGPDDRPMVVAVTRGDAHFLVALERQW